MMKMGAGSMGWLTCDGCFEHYAKTLLACPRCGKTAAVSVTIIVPTIDGPQPAVAAEKLAEVTRPGGISVRGARVRAVLVEVDRQLNDTLDNLLLMLRGQTSSGVFYDRVAVQIHDPRHRQDFNKAAKRLRTEAAKLRAYPLEAQRTVLSAAALAFDTARDRMRACGDALTKETDAKT